MAHVMRSHVMAAGGVESRISCAVGSRCAEASAAGALPVTGRRWDGAGGCAAKSPAVSRAANGVTAIP